MTRVKRCRPLFWREALGRLAARGRDGAQDAFEARRREDECIRERVGPGVLEGDARPLRYEYRSTGAGRVPLPAKLHTTGAAGDENDLILLEVAGSPIASPGGRSELPRTIRVDPVLTGSILIKSGAVPPRKKRSSPSLAATTAGRA